MPPGVPMVPTLSRMRLTCTPCALLGDQGLRETLADLVVLEDVGLHVDVVARRHDGRQHRLVGGRAVLQQQHLVARGQRAADDGLLERQVAVEDVGVLAAGSPGRSRIALLCAADSGPRAPSSCTGGPERRARSGTMVGRLLQPARHEQDEQGPAQPQPQVRETADQLQAR